MKAEELRIGNLVNTTDILIPKHIIKAEDIVSIFDGSFKKLGLDIKPIPLTEEWLLKFGGGKSDEHELCVICNDIRFVYDYHFKRFSIEIADDEGIYLDHIKHVHQLQNLYFALTREELTVK